MYRVELINGRIIEVDEQGVRKHFDLIRAFLVDPEKPDLDKFLEERFHEKSSCLAEKEKGQECKDKIVFI